MDSEYTEATLDYIRTTSLDHRKRHGQYFTPNTVRDILFSKLPAMHSPSILDPAVGTGEFLHSARHYYPDASLEGWEIDPKLHEICSSALQGSEIKCLDSILYQNNKKYDLIVGNPPYFQLCPTLEMKKEYGEIICGRSNIYAFFIYKSLKLLKTGGYLAFVVPPSMNNGAYFAKLRSYIAANYEVEFIKVLNNTKLFTDAQQAIMILIIRKVKNTGKYIFSKNGITIFSENYRLMNNIYKNKTTFSDLGWMVKTGSIVWNKNREYLTCRAEGNTLLVWAHNIKKGRLEINNNAAKPQYIKARKRLIGPAIVTNRIVGQPNNARLNAAYIEPGVEFLAENHVNVIIPNFVDKVTIADVLKQLNASESTMVLFSISGNTQISKTELEKLYPINLSFGS